MNQNQDAHLKKKLVVPFGKSNSMRNEKSLLENPGGAALINTLCTGAQRTECASLVCLNLIAFDSKLS
jgi:hypothetical protein